MAIRIDHPPCREQTSSARRGGDEAHLRWSIVGCRQYPSSQGEAGRRHQREHHRVRRHVHLHSNERDHGFIWCRSRPHTPNGAEFRGVRCDVPNRCFFRSTTAARSVQDCQVRAGLHPGSGHLPCTSERPSDHPSRVPSHRYLIKFVMYNFALTRIRTKPTALTASMSSFKVNWVSYGP